MLTKRSSSYTIWFQMRCGMTSCLNHDCIILIFIHFPYLKLLRRYARCCWHLTLHTINVEKNVSRPLFHYLCLHNLGLVGVGVGVFWCIVLHFGISLFVFIAANDCMIIIIPWLLFICYNKTIAAIYDVLPYIGFFFKQIGQICQKY